MNEEETLTLEQSRQNTGIRVVNLGLGGNILLAAAKTAVGILGHSPALLADGINSVSDVAYYIVVSVFMRLAYKPADDEHPYGHSQLETIAALVVGAFVMTTGITVFWESVNNVFDLWAGQGGYSGASLLALLIGLGTIFVKIGLAVYSRREGRRTKNPVVLALAYDHRNDVFTATAATAGIFLGRAGFPWFDPLAGALVALVILRTGIRIVSDSASDLMDTIPGVELAGQVQGLLCGLPGLRQIEEIKAHRFGPYLVMNLTIGVDGNLTVTEGDFIATQVESILLEQVSMLRRVHVHYHPAHPQDAATGLSCNEPAFPVNISSSARSREP